MLALNRLKRAIGDVNRGGMQTGDPKVTLKLPDAQRIVLELERLENIKRKFDWLCDNVSERVIQNQSEYAALKTRYELPLMIAYADFCGDISFEDAVDIAMRNIDEQENN